MRFKRIRRLLWRVYLRCAVQRSLYAHYSFYVVFILLSLIGLTYFATSAFRQYFIEHLRQELAERAELLLPQVRSADLAAIGPRCAPLAAGGEHRITLIAPDGKVLCDSASDPQSMEGHAQRFEVSEALAGREGNAVRYSATLRETLLYAARPLRDNGATYAVLRLALPLDTMERQLRRLSLTLFVAGLFITFLIAVVSSVMYRRIIQPLQEMRAKALRVAKGELDYRLPAYGVREIAELAQAMNAMGAELRHLEKIRTDFVANVSHELKTPITAIRGFVETLLEGAMEDKEDLPRFLEIVSKQSERMSDIVDGLLMLSRLESEQAKDLLVLQEEMAYELLQSVAELARVQAEQKSIALEVRCDPLLAVTIDRSLMEHALMNLVSNAIKYAPPESSVFIGAEEKEDEVVFSVADSGPGIAAEHQPRLFERFYRVDRARTRSEGGTGLGLAIVKHVVSVHNGRVGVLSKVGQGSTFTIYLPHDRES